MARPTPTRSDGEGRVSAASITAAHAGFATAVILEMNGETDEALDHYVRAAEQDPGNEWLLLEVTRRLIQQRKLDEALVLLQGAANRPDVTGPELARLGMVYSQLGKHDLAIAASRASIQKSPSDLAAYQSLFFNHLHARQSPEALKVLDDAGRALKPSVEFLIGLSELYANYTTQNPSEREAIKPKVIALLNKVRKMAPRDTGLQLKLADGFSSFGDTASAAEVYLELLKRDTGIPMLRENVHAKLASIYLRASDRKSAQEQLQALVVADPTNPQPYFFLGHLAVDDKKLPEAADFFSNAILLNPDFDQAYYELANVQLALDKPAEALATIEKARAKFPSNFFMEFGSGIACARLKDFDRALEYFTAAEIVGNASDPKRVNHFFYFQLGIAYEQKKDFVEAARAFEKCLELSPDFDEAMNYLGYMWADRGENLDKALELLLKAVKREPKNAAYLDSLGWVYFKLNRLQEALDHIVEALKLSEEPDATLNEHLGDIYHAMGNQEKALEAWTKGLEIDPTDSLKKKVAGARGTTGNPQ